MADIHVIYPAGGSAIIGNEGEFMPSGERVTWCLHTDDPNVDSFEVEFSDPALHLFFTGHNPAHKYEKKVKDNRADFYGHVPDYAGKKVSIIAKYTVRGLDVNGITVFEIDPVIITPKP